jgi:hypothetical protein
LPSHWTSQNLEKFLALYPSPTAAAPTTNKAAPDLTANESWRAKNGINLSVCVSLSLQTLLECSAAPASLAFFLPSRDVRNIHGGAGLAFFTFFP